MIKKYKKEEPIIEACQFDGTNAEEIADWLMLKKNIRGILTPTEEFENIQIIGSSFNEKINKGDWIKCDAINFHVRMSELAYMDWVKDYSEVFELKMPWQDCWPAMPPYRPGPMPSTSNDKPKPKIRFSSLQIDGSWKEIPNDKVQAFLDYGCQVRTEHE